jgi:hypothetical protein
MSTGERTVLLHESPVLARTDPLNNAVTLQSEIGYITGLGARTPWGRCVFTQRHTLAQAYANGTENA